jgi:hypothetical protein
MLTLLCLCITWIIHITILLKTSIESTNVQGKNFLSSVINLATESGATLGQEEEETGEEIG